MDDRLNFDDFYFKPGALALSLALTPYWSDQDFRDLHNVWSKQLDADPEDLLRVMTLESRLKPDEINKFSRAVGLIQISRVGFQLLGLLPSASPPGSAKAIEADKKAQAMMPALAAQVSKMSVREQMEKHTLPYFKYWRSTFKGPWTALKLYTAIIAPSLLNAPVDKDTVLYASPSVEYVGNKQLDIDNDLRITTGDLVNAVDWHLKTPEFVAAKYRYRLVNDLYPFKNPALPPSFPT